MSGTPSSTRERIGLGCVGQITSYPVPVPPPDVHLHERQSTARYCCLPLSERHAVGFQYQKQQIWCFLLQFLYPLLGGGFGGEMADGAVFVHQRAFRPAIAYGQQAGFRRLGRMIGFDGVCSARIRFHDVCPFQVACPTRCADCGCTSGFVGGRGVGIRRVGICPDSDVQAACRKNH